VLATSKKTIARWEHGVVPDQIAQSYLARVLDVPADYVHKREWPAWLPVGARSDERYTWDQSGTNQILDVTLRSAHLDRRNLLSLTGALLTEPAYEWLLHTISGGAAIGSSQGRQRVTHQTVQHLRELTHSLRMLDEEHGSGVVEPLVREHLGLVVGLLDRGAYDEKVGSGLYAVAAEVNQLAGWLAFDMGRHASAQSYWTTGLRAAYTAGDRAMGSNILHLMSYQAYSTAHPLEAASLAGIGLSPGIKTTAKMRSVLLSRKALAESLTDGRQQCSATLSKAAAELDRTREDEEPYWLQWYRYQDLMGAAGLCFIETGDYKEAERRLREAVGNREETFVRADALFWSYMALARLCQGRLDEACALGIEVAKTAADITSPRLVTRVRSLRDTLSTRYTGEPLTRRFNDEIGALLPAV
jgi:tetratricopeptide (TPR) repeat protein